MSSFRVPRLLLTATLALATTLARSTEIKVEDATIAQLQTAMAKGTLTAEHLTEIYLARIAAYDKQGPAINTVIALNQMALETARVLDAERKAGKVRGPLHGIPIVLKDNFDTFDLPTTAGSQLLAGSIPVDDAYVVKKLRDAGAIILAKVNLSEFAGGGGSVSGAKDPAVIKKSPRSYPRPVRLLRRHRCRDRRRLRAIRHGHRYRRLGARSVVRQRPRRPEAHARSSLA